MKICQHISAVLAEPDVGTISHLFLVGGFAESPLLQVTTMMITMMMVLINTMMVLMITMKMPAQCWDDLSSIPCLGFAESQLLQGVYHNDDGKWQEYVSNEHNGMITVLDYHDFHHKGRQNPCHQSVDDGLCRRKCEGDSVRK